MNTRQQTMRMTHSLAVQIRQQQVPLAQAVGQSIAQAHGPHRWSRLHAIPPCSASRCNALRS